MYRKQPKFNAYKPDILIMRIIPHHFSKDWNNQWIMLKYRYYFDYITLNGITYPQQRGYSSEHVKGKTFKNVTNGVIKERFKAYNIKPTIIIDMTKATLDKNFKDGTKNSSYEIIIN